MIGRTLRKRYKITELLGKGAMGTVYRAIDITTRQAVALKIIASELAIDPAMLERFEREGEALRQLNHPNVVRFVDAFRWAGPNASDNAISARMRGLFPRPVVDPAPSKREVVADECYVIVMEYVLGGNLYDLIKAGPLSIERTRQIGLDLCDALIRAHRLNIVHRDIKPENILLDEHGTPRLADFGVARITAGTRMTRTGTQVGTPYYMAPEAWEGKPLDAQADIWSLGVVFYEMLSGQVPFDGDTGPVVMTKVLTTQPPDLMTLRNDAPPDFVKLIARMLTREKEERYRTMREVAVDLERAQLAAAPSADENREFAGKTRIITERETTENIVPEKEEKEAGEKARLEAEEPVRQIAASEKKVHEDTNSIERVRKEKEVREKQSHEVEKFEQKHKELEKAVYKKKANPSNALKSKASKKKVYWLGGFASLVLGIVLFSTLSEQPRSPEATPTGVITNSPYISSTAIPKTPTFQITSTVTPLPTPTAIGGGLGKIIFESFKDDINSIHIINADGSELKKLTEGLYSDYIEALSPDGKKILFSSSRNNFRDFYVMDVSSENIVKLTNTSSSNWVEFKGWSPDSAKIVYRADADLFLINVDGTGLVNLTNGIVSGEIVRWSPKGDKLLFENGGYWGSGEIYCVNMDGTGLVNLTNHVSNDWFEDWMPNDEGIIFSSERDGNLEIYRVALDGSDMENLSQGLGDDIYGSLSLEQSHMFFSSNRSGNYEIYKMDLKSFSVDPLTSNLSDDYFKSYSSDGTKFIFESMLGNDAEIYVANIDGSNPVNLTESVGEDHFQEWMPNSESILFSSNRNNNDDFFVVDLDGANLINLTKNPEHDKFISWSPNNEKMLFSYEAVSTVNRSNEYGTWSVQDEDVVVYVTNPDGSDPTIFSDIPLNYNSIESAFWSPDGTKVVLSLYKEASTYVPDMFIVDIDDADVVKIEYANDPIWLP